MFVDVYQGEQAAKQPIRVLILGESHYEGESKINGTADVVRYRAVEGNDNKTSFFKNIMKTFGYDPIPEQRLLFWSKVYCGNYVSELCGIRKNNTAADKIKNNRKRYNDELFAFVNDHDIDIVFCFSRLVYRYLPAATSGENEELLINHRTNSLKRFVYQAGVEHNECGIVLKKPLVIYGLKHPSAGFSPTVYRDYFDAVKLGK